MKEIKPITLAPTTRRRAAAISVHRNGAFFFSMNCVERLGITHKSSVMIAQDPEDTENFFIYPTSTGEYVVNRYPSNDKVYKFCSKQLRNLMADALYPGRDPAMFRLLLGGDSEFKVNGKKVRAWALLATPIE